MIRRVSLAAAGRGRRSAGAFTLVEMIISMIVFTLLTTAILTTIIGVNTSVKNTRTEDNINEEARVALNRMSRELRQARSIDAVSSPDGKTSITFEADFNQDGVIESCGNDPEVITYTYNASAQDITMTGCSSGGVIVTQPVLAANVSAFQFSYSSHLYQYDANDDGTTTWQELDASTLGNGNGVLDLELPYIDEIGIFFSVLTGVHKQTYQTSVDLRNRQ